MPIYIDPSEQRSNSLFPSSINVIPINGLEDKFGCDFVVSPSEVPPILNLISPANGSYFVQRKSAWDIQSFDQLKRSIARMKKANIPQKQCVLLLIGRYGKNPMDNSLIVNDQQSNNAVNIDIFYELQALWEGRGGVCQTIPHKDHLIHWINGRLLAIKNFQKKPHITMYSEQNDMSYIDEAGFQIVEEVEATDIKSLLCRGLPNFGHSKASAVVDCLNEYGLRHTLFNALFILTYLDGQGKMGYKIAGIGNKTFETLRELILADNVDNLALVSNAHIVNDDKMKCWHRGWMAALDGVAQEFSNGSTNLKQVLSKLQVQSQEWNE